MSNIVLDPPQSELTRKAIDDAIKYNKENIQYGTVRELQQLKDHIETERTRNQVEAPNESV